MILKVSPSTLSGSIQAPSSKSLSQRFIAVSILAASQSKLIDVSECDDCTAAIGMAAELGAEIELGSNGIMITPTPLGIPQPRTGKLNAGESGLGLRLFGPISALSGENIEITSEGTLSQRSQTQMLKGLEDLGLEISSNSEFPPIKISGCLNGGNIEIGDQ